VGSTVVFSATAGGAVTIQYKWLLFDGVSWSTAQDWSAHNTFSWTPNAPNPNYQVQVRAQNVANTADNAGASLLFPIGGHGNRRGHK
jgi:hypothetical protein